MKKLFIMILVSLALASCTREPIAVVELTYDNGTPKLVRFYEKEGDTVPIREIHYYADSAVRMEGNLKDGLRDGDWKYYYDNGNVWSTGHYVNGKENGRKAVYHENGQIYYEGMVKNGQRTGIWRFFDKTGKLLKEVDYNKGK